jgi:hypothetical protein
MRFPPVPDQWNIDYQLLFSTQVEALARQSRKVGEDLIVGGNDGTRVERVIYPSIEGWGVQVDPIEPTYPWKDLRGHILSRTGGNAPPAFSQYIGDIYQWNFDSASQEQEVFNEYHMPHDYAVGTDLYVHTHWSVDAASTGDVNWLFDLAYAKGYDQAVFEGTAGSGSPVTVSVTQSSPTAFKHQIAEVECSASGGLISPATVNVSITSGTAALTAASALFTAADIGRTVTIVGAGSGGADLETTISGYSSTTSVTLADNASTTVSAQDAFRYRVLDTDLLEVDGLIMVRTWRHATRTADTLNQAPFLHEIDIHYQSTGIGTKGRNGPDFWS